MPQAEKPNSMSRLSTTIPSRRGFLTGAAASIAAGPAIASQALGTVTVPPVETPLSGLAPGVASPDPVFVLIERHRKAVLEENRLCKIFRKRENDKEDEDHRGVVVGERPKLRQEVIRNDPRSEIHLRWLRDGPEMEPIVVFDESSLAEYAPTEDEERTAWIKEKTKELRRNQCAFDKRYRNSPRSYAYEAWNEACEITASLSGQLFETRPTTTAGIVALLAHWAEVMSEESHDRDFIATQELLENLGRIA